MPRELINHIGVSGGKDSVALLLWALHESGYPRESIKATFCDTGNESPVTIAHVAMLNERVWPIETIRPELGFYDLALKKGLFPSKRARFCTYALKIEPSRRWVQAQIAAGASVREHTGVRRDESFDRSELEEWDYDGETLCELRRPLVTWGIDDVLAIHARHEVPLCPLYGMGSSRVGCYPCVMSRKEEIAAASIHFPDVIDLIERKEKEMSERAGNGTGHFFPKKMIPEEWRSGKVQGKDGREHRVGTIRDVVEWALTEWGGRQVSLFPGYQYDHGLSCSASRGWCE